MKRRSEILVGSSAPALGTTALARVSAGHSEALLERSPAPAFRKAHFRFALVHTFATLLLLLVGGLVTSRDAGLAVPDWPTSYGRWWFIPMPGNVLYEHGHRLVAQLVGLLTIVHMTWMLRRETRAWLRWASVAMLAAVIVQGVLGGITVKYYLPPAVSVAHGCFAQLFLCLSIAVSYFLSREWILGEPAMAPEAVGLRRTGGRLFGVVLAQLLLGAIVRHTASALVIPDFPLSLGRVVPPLEDPKVAVHFAHRAGALVVLLTVIGYWVRLARSRDFAARLTGPAASVALLVLLQVALGAFTVLTKTRWDIASLHQFNGALILGCCAFLVLRSCRLRLRKAEVG